MVWPVLISNMDLLHRGSHCLPIEKSQHPSSDQLTAQVAIFHARSPLVMLWNVCKAMQSPCPSGGWFEPWHCFASTSYQAVLNRQLVCSMLVYHSKFCAFMVDPTKAPGLDVLRMALEPLGAPGSPWNPLAEPPWQRAL